VAKSASAQADEDDDEDDDGGGGSVRKRTAVSADKTAGSSTRRDGRVVPRVNLEAAWERKLSNFRQFVAEHGHGRVPLNLDSEEYPQLGAWVRYQRTAFARRRRGGKGAMTHQRIARLRSARFLFLDPVRAHAWDNKFESLRAYVREHKTALVPRGLDTPDYPGLGAWVYGQGMQYRQQQQDKKTTSGGASLASHRRRLTPLRVAQLDSVGFVWDVHKHHWDEMFKVLCKYVQKHGHAKVPQSANESTGFPGLGAWVSRQRRARQNMDLMAAGRKPKSNNSWRISPEQVARLDKMGFEWTGVAGRQWEWMWKHLEAFVKKYGNAHVPACCSSFPGFEALGPWVVTQRMQRRRGLLSKERVVKLEALGLAWEVGKWAPNPNLQKQRENAKRPVVWPDIL
jgi:hypothetical protein